ncbi:MAG: hydrogenase expression/formation protein HupK [Arenibacterium sp.]
MLDAAAYPLRARPSPALPVSKLVIGKPVEEAAALLPRLFNLCRVAQGIAVRAAFRLALEDGWQEKLRAEILREHVVKLCLKWPGLMSLPGSHLPRGWQSDPALLRKALFGACEGLPVDWAGYQNWLVSGLGVSPVLNGLSTLFAPHEAVREVLPISDPTTVFSTDPQENSAAARRAGHPVMQQIETRWGRGPFWSATGVLYDLEALLMGVRLPLCMSDGQVVVAAARGSYGVRATVEDGQVTRFARVTPTDHLLAPGGALDQSLLSLPREKAQALAPLVLSVLDPCFPVTLEETGEATDA